MIPSLLRASGSHSPNLAPPRLFVVFGLAASQVSSDLHSQVAVYGVFERTGLVVSWDVANNSPYSAVVQMPVGFAEKNGRLKWNLDGSPPGIPAAVEAVETALPGYIKGCILASEAPAEPAEIEVGR